MGPCASQGHQSWLAPVFGPRHGCTHETEVPVRFDYSSPKSEAELIAAGYCRQPGQTSTDDVKKRDLRLELLAAEAEARNKKRKAEGKPPLEEDVRKVAAIEAPKDGTTTAAEDDETNKRRKLLQEALEMDKDDDEDDEEEKIDDDGDERYLPEAVGYLSHY